MNKRDHKKLLMAVLLLVLSCACLYVSRVFADIPPTNTALIAANTLAGLPSCLHYEIKGTCFWVTPTGVPVATQYVQHYLPDVVVSVFSQEDDNPWLEMRDTLDQAGKLAENKIVEFIAQAPAAGGQHSLQNPLEQHVFFKQADVIGNPALPMLPTTPALLPTTAVPLMPYFQSMPDATLWRGFPPLALPEQAYAYGMDITHYVGSGAMVWGGAYPTEGKTFAGNDAKAAAVIAQRAGNLLTATNGWGHLYKSLSTNCGTECAAAVIQEDDDKTQFQEIYPDFSATCEVFGRSENYGENVTTPANGAYLWVLWRQYHGCIAAPGCTYLGKVVIE